MLRAIWTKELRLALVYGTYSQLFWLDEMEGENSSFGVDTVIGGLTESGEIGNFDQDTYKQILAEIINHQASNDQILAGITKEWLKTPILVRAVMLVFWQEFHSTKDIAGFNIKKLVSQYIAIATTHIGETGSNLVHALSTGIIKKSDVDTKI